jgi:Protein of unknown function (DUF2380)
MQMGQRIGVFGPVCVCLSLLTHPGWTQTAAPSLAVIELDYIDTSGEVRDQRADHARRLKAFEESLRDDLAMSGKFRIVAFDCLPNSCPRSTAPPAELAAQAEKAGAAYVLFGGIHKESMLIQWAKIEILDVGKQKIVFDRLLSFRGDDDMAWRRAERFLARDILEQDALK